RPGSLVCCMNAACEPSGGGGTKNVPFATPERPEKVQPPVGSTGLYTKAPVIGCSNDAFRIVAAEAAIGSPETHNTSKPNFASLKHPPRINFSCLRIEGRSLGQSYIICSAFRTAIYILNNEQKGPWYPEGQWF